MERKPRFGTEWEKELRADEVGTRRENDDEIKVVLLAGLQRCGQLAGLKKSRCHHSFIDTNRGGFFQCVYSGEFDDGSEWVGTADCSHLNTEGGFQNYPTAIAESRAEARMLRKALGIKSLSSEEIGFREGIPQMESSLESKVDDQVIKAIEKMVESKKMSLMEVFEAVISKERLEKDVFSLEDLNTEEASKVMEWLNSPKTTKQPKAKKPSKKEEREARKKALKESLA